MADKLSPLDALLSSDVNSQIPEDIPDTGNLPVSSAPVPQAPVPPQQEAQPIPTGARPILFDAMAALGLGQTQRQQPAIGPMGAQGPDRISRAASFESFLGNLIFAMGQGFEHAGSGPGSFSRGFGAAVTAPMQLQASQAQMAQQRALQQAQIEREQAQTQQTQRQTALAGQMITLPNGVTLPASALPNFYRGGFAAQTSAQARRFISVPNVGLVDTAAEGGPKVIAAKQNGGIPISADLASQFNIPQEFVGQDIDLKTLAAIEKLGPTTTTKLQKDPVTGLVTSTVSTTVRGGPTGKPSGFPRSGAAVTSPANAPASAQPSAATNKGDIAAKYGGTSSVPVMLVDGNMDPSQLSKRGSTYTFFLQQADKYNRERYGQPFDIAQASTDYAFAKSPQTQNVLKYLNSLTGSDNKSGNLGSLVTLSDKIDRTDFPGLNDLAAWARLQTGSPQMASYYTAVTEVADQVGKILQGGGSGAGTSDAKLKQAQEMFNTGFSKDQIKGVATTLRDLLANRKKELIGDNRYLQKQFAGRQPVRGSSGNSVVDSLVTKYGR